MRNPVLSLACLVLPCSIILSCSSSHKKENVTAAKDSTLIQLPAPKEISPFEKNALAASCQRWYDSLLDKTGFNGAVLVAKGGNIIFEKYKGTGHLNASDTITDTTPLHIASVSKTITAMAILKLAQDGKLNIDDEFSKYFPEFNYPGVTIRTLLNHRSGLPNYLYFMEDLGWDKSVYIKNEDILAWLINRKADIPNIATPGKHFTYCNTNYALLALLAEKISHSSFPEFIQNTFFKPLGMQHSFVFTHADSARVCPSYDWRGQLIPTNFLDHVYGDKNVYTTVEDLLRWDRALRCNLLFTPATLTEAYTPYSNEKPGVRNYGLGWRMNIYPNGKKLIYHNGWWHGYNASFIRLLDEDATIIVMGNKFTKAIYKSKTLAPVFGANYVVGEEEENDNKTETVSPASGNTKKKVRRRRK
ncbi:MAG: beta-lactamase family protein [Bacteroidetes bacterium]|nr:beta-lactamase family protein [Bacteroidota bacterium]